MKKSYSIHTQPEYAKEILKAFYTDVHLSRTFDGTIRKGKIKGVYTILGLINGMVIGYVKVRGEYNLQTGRINCTVLPSNLYWIACAFLVVSFGIQAIFDHTPTYSTRLIGGIFVTFMVSIFTLIYLLERNGFIRHLKRLEQIHCSL